MMNDFQKALNTVLEQNSEGLELISKGPNKLRGILRGVVYENYADLPNEARFAIARSIQPHLQAYTMLRQKYDSLEAEERLCWCLFGSVDSRVDISLDRSRTNIEVSSHCSFTKCQYGRPFCLKVLNGLTKREQQCFLLMRGGMTDKEVANVLGISYLTVLKHINNAVCRFRDMTDSNVTRQYILSQLVSAGV